MYYTFPCTKQSCLHLKYYWYGYNNTYYEINWIDSRQLNTSNIFLNLSLYDFNILFFDSLTFPCISTKRYNSRIFKFCNIAHPFLDFVSEFNITCFYVWNYTWLIECRKFLTSAFIEGLNNFNDIQEKNPVNNKIEYYLKKVVILKSL